MERATASALLVCVVTTAALAAGCSETPYVFFRDGAGGQCRDAGCDCARGACGGREPDEAGIGGAPGAVGDGAAGELPAAPGSDCESSRDEAITLERLQLVTSGLCVAQGPYAPLRGEPAYATMLSRCDESLAQMWAMTLVDGSLELRNEAVDLNLDVRFAASDDGTPLVLYEPHQLYNQRFDVVEIDDSFKLMPLHAPLQCVTERDAELVLLPCEDGMTRQLFRRIACR